MNNIYWTSRTIDTYVVWCDGKIVGDYLTFDDCYNLVMKLKEKPCS